VSLEALDVFWHIWRASSSFKFVAAETGRNCIAVAPVMW